MHIPQKKWISSAIFCLAILSPVLAANAAAWPNTPAPHAASVIEPATHSTPGATCGISSGNFARTCRSGTLERCMNAVARKVEGFTAERCTRERDACSSCLSQMHTCIGRIGHAIGRITKSTCDSCTTRFNTCLDRARR